MREQNNRYEAVKAEEYPLWNSQTESRYSRYFHLSFLPYVRNSHGDLPGRWEFRTWGRNVERRVLRTELLTTERDAETDFRISRVRGALHVRWCLLDSGYLGLY